MSHYRLLGELGHGGMGVVYRAEDLRLGRRVALKFLPDRLSQDRVALERFQREARAASALQHPHICIVHDFGEMDGKPFIAMELLEGETLRHRLHRKTLKLERLLNLSIQIADALQSAHSKGIVHRDVKPSNIFLTNQDEAKLLDFGLAKHVPRGAASAVGTSAGSTEVAEEELTSPGIAVGTVAYMSPEQARGQTLDARTDLFSLGAVMYEMACGHVAFPGDTTAVIFEAILNRQPPPLQARNAVFPPQLDAIISKALEKDRELRYQTAAEIRSDLKRLKRDLESARVRAAAAPAAETTGARRRRPVSFWQAGAAALLLGSAGIFVSWKLGWFPSGGDGPLPRLSQRQLTTNPPENFVAASAISQDGTYLAYVDQEGLKIQTIATGEVGILQAPIGAPVIRDVTWYPDGSRLLVAAAPRWDETAFDLWAIPIVGGAARKVREGGRAPSFSPDGSQIAFLTAASDTLGSEQLWVMGPLGQSPHRVYVPTERTTLGRPVWSPAGTRIAFAKTNRFGVSGQSVTFENVDLHGGGSSVMATGSLADFEGRLGLSGYVWLPDGRFLFGKAESPPNASDLNLWSVRCDPESGARRGSSQRVTNWSGFQFYQFSATRDGGQALLKLSAQHEICTADLSASDPLSNVTWGTHDGADDTNGHWSPDSKAFVYASNRRGNYDIYVQSIGMSEPEVVSAGPDDEISPQFADGDHILFGTRRRAQASGDYWLWISGDIARVHRSGGAAQAVARMPSGRAVMLLCASRPGAGCVLASWNESQVLYSRLDPESGEETFLLRLPRSGYWLESLSPDARSMVRFQGPAGRFQVVDLDRRHVRDISLPDSGWVAGAAWLPDATGLVLSVQRPDGWAFVSSDLEGNGRTLWSTADRWFFPRFLQVSPDGTRLLFDRLVTSGNVWMISGL